MVTRIQEIHVPDALLDELESLVRQLPVAALLAEAPSGRIIAANTRAEEIWRSELPLARSIEEYSDLYTGFRPNGRQYEPDEWPLARALRDGEGVVDEEIEFRFGTGARRILLVSAAPQRDQTGVIRAALVTFHDITDQQHEERRREFLMELTDEMRILDDPIAIMEVAATSTGEQLGVSNASYADIELDGPVAVVPAEYRHGRIAPLGKYHLEDFGQQLLDELRDGRTVAIEDFTVDPRAAGDLFELWGTRAAIAVPLIRRGRWAALFTVMHNAPRRWSRSDVALVEHVAERTWHAVETARTQAELRQSREWLTLALRAGSAAIWEWDLRTGEIHWSEEDDAVLGLKPPRRSLTFNRWLALVHPDDQETARAAGRRIAAMGEGELELEYRIASSGRWVTMRGRAIADARGLPRRVVGVAVDTTERKAAELERERLLRDAREASDAKSHFIGVISHEFRTPLTAIIGYADLLATGVSGTLSAPQQRQLDRVRASAWHLTQMVDEILTFSRIEAGRESLVVAPTDVPTLVREAMGLMGPGAEAKGLSLICELPDEPVRIKTDSGKLRQILLNLLSNAVKFTDKGGVTLRVRHVQDAVEFVVVDTGIGIATQDLAHIFDRFWQAHNPQRVASGAGLGLTVSMQLTRLLHGELIATSEVGVGSTFRLVMPLAR